MPEYSKPCAKSLVVDGKIVTDPKMVANVFNGYFTSIVLKIVGSPPLAASFTTHVPPYIPAFHFPTITSKYIVKQLQNMP